MTEVFVKSRKFSISLVVFVVLLLMASVNGYARETTGQQGKALDGKIQRVKSEVLGIVKELDKLEERLLYPSHTQVSILVSMRKNQSFELDSLDVEVDGKEVAHHVYTSKEIEALRMGGVQRIYTGNVTIGKHEMKVTMRGKSSAGDRIRVEKSLSFEKTVEPAIAELLLSDKTITLIDR